MPFAGKIAVGFSPRDAIGVPRTIVLIAILFTNTGRFWAGALWQALPLNPTMYPL